MNGIGSSFSGTDNADGSLLFKANQTNMTFWFFRSWRAVTKYVEVL